jgi:hypothetical protein
MGGFAAEADIGAGSLKASFFQKQLAQFIFGS